MVHINKSVISRCLLVILATFMFASLLALALTPLVEAASGDLEITGPGLNGRRIIISQGQLRGTEPLFFPDGTMVEQEEEWYSAINTWPSKIWYRGQGIKLRDLLRAAGGVNEQATLIKFTARDGLTMTFTLEELINEPAYRFPNFMDGGLEGHLPGDPSEAVQVEPLLAHKSFSHHKKLTIMTEENELTGSDAPHLLFGQRAITQQNNARFIKQVTKIEILTDEIDKWDKPSVSPAPGLVAAGTLVKLCGPYGDEDKVHYTIDGSKPGLGSPMYNLVASRWWSSRRDLDDINRPIEITEDTTIKAVTIGPGKADSDIVSFIFRVKEDEEETGKTLTDINGHWAQNNIIKLVNRGAISGYIDGTFRPDHIITRAEYVTVLLKAFQMEGEGERVFADTKSHWAKGYIAAAVAKGIDDGYDSTTFGPDDVITREQMAVMVARAANLVAPGNKIPFADGDKISPGAVDRVAAAVEKGIIRGYPDNTFRPQGSASRAEAVTIITRALP